MRDDISTNVKQFAHRLIEFETGTATAASVGDHKSPAFCVCEKLRQPLSRLAGVAGFRSLLSRALALASGELRWLKAIHIAADGSLKGWDDTQAQLSPHEIREGEVLLVTQLLGLLVTFIGEGLTMRLLLDAWPDVAFDDRQG